MNRQYHKTPAGGDYSEIFYLDDANNIVEPEEATHGAIRECKMDGTLVQETWFVTGRKQK
ncbi:MAG: hypothetical protein IJ899_22430 [Blautia sp.]|nr:hypothetical protein [Blautia sp.]